MDAKVHIYHFLCASFGDGVSILQIIDLDVLDEVSILGIDILAD